MAITLEPRFSMEFSPIDRSTSLTIIQVGCGGTGSYIVPAVCQYVASLNLRIPFQYILIDGDIVEEKNLVRQRFISADLGKNKAEVLAQRYSAAFGLSVQALPRYLGVDGVSLLSLFPQRSSSDKVVVLSAVDNHRARLSIASAIFGKALSYPFVPIACFDAGNNMWNGQVQFYFSGQRFFSSFENDVFDYKLSPRTILPPMLNDFSLMEKTLTDVLITDQCAINAEQVTQTINANMLSAQCVISMLYQYLAGTLDVMALYFDAKTGAVQAEAFSESNLEKNKLSHETHPLYVEFFKSKSTVPDLRTIHNLFMTARDRGYVKRRLEVVFDSSLDKPSTLSPPVVP